MRRFDRLDAPAIWVENEAKWSQQWQELLARKTNAGFTWYSHEGTSARGIAMPVLRAQTGEHCSFCDGFPVDDVSLETIEHFRPKSRFPQYAYTWTNLYFCCTKCQSHKLERWDDDLLAPDAQGYDFRRYFEFDFTSGAIRPSTRASEADQRRAQATISFYGLDTGSRRRWRLLFQKLWNDSNPATRQLHEFPHRDFIVPALSVPEAQNKSDGD